MATFTSIPEVIESYRERFLPDEASGFDGVVQLNLTGEGGGNYYMTIRDQTFDIAEGEYADPSVSVTTSAEEWLAVNNGTASPMTLMMQGKLKLKGSLPMATKFQSMFRRD